MKKNRNKQIDILKGIAIIMIVLGHCSSPFTHFLYLFHLAIFFMVSGYFWKENSINTIKDLKRFIINKVKRLYVPFVIGNVICVLLNNFLIDINIYSTISHSHFSYKDMAKNIIKVLLFRNSTELLGASWFLRILFIISIIYAIVELILTKYLKKFNKNIFHLILSCFLLILGYLLSINNIDLKIVDTQVFICYIFFDLGRKISKYKVNTNNISKFIGLVISFVLLYILNKVGSIEISKNQYTNIIYFLTVSLLGWFFVYELSYYCSKIKIVKDLLQYIGQNTMPILMCHFIAFKIINLVGVIILSKEITMISAFPVLLKGGYWWIIYTIAGVLLPLVFNKIYILLKNKCMRKNKVLGGT